MLVYGLKGLACNLRVIYTEPREYAPSKDEYEKYKGHLENAPTLPSYGVHQVVRTPGLASSVMLRHPSLVLAFASFNEQLIRALLSTISPNRLFLVNSEPPRFPWRADATQEIHRKLIEEYPDDNPFDAVGRLARKSSTLDYIETFELLADVYRRQCYYTESWLLQREARCKLLAWHYSKYAARTFTSNILLRKASSLRDIAV